MKLNCGATLLAIQFLKVLRENVHGNDAVGYDPIPGHYDKGRKLLKLLEIHLSKHKVEVLLWFGNMAWGDLIDFLQVNHKQLDGLQLDMRPVVAAMLSHLTSSRSIKQE